MYSLQEQVSAFSKHNVDAFLAFANIGAASAERFFDFQVRTAKAALAEAVENTRAVASAKDPQQLTEITTSLAQPAAEKTAAYARHLAQLASETQGEFTKLFESQVAEWNKQFTTALDDAAKSAPAGSETFVSAVKNAWSNANHAFDAFQQVSKQAASAAETALQTATKTGTETLKRATKATNARTSRSR